MKVKIKDLISLIEEKKETKKIEKQFVEDVRTWISFFQHERLIHLIVTFFTGIASILFLLGALLLDSLPLLLLFALTLCLFIPYIFHYYTLENGVQKLYNYYFEIKEKL